MYLSECEEEEVPVDICKKKMTDRGVNEEMKRLVSKIGWQKNVKKGLML